MSSQPHTQMNRTSFNSCQLCVPPSTLCSVLLAISQVSNTELSISPELDVLQDFVDKSLFSTNIKQKEHPHSFQEPASLVVSCWIVTNLRKALHLVWKAYPWTQVTSWTKQLHENDTVLQLQLHLNCIRSRWYGVLQWTRNSGTGTTQQCNIQVTRTNKIHRPGISLQLLPTHRHHHPPPKANYLPGLQKCFHASRGTTSHNTHICSLDRLKFCFWGKQACPTLVHGSRNCLLPCELFPSYHSTRTLFHQSVSTDLNCPLNCGSITTPSPTSSHSLLNSLAPFLYSQLSNPQSWKKMLPCIYVPR